MVTLISNHDNLRDECLNCELFGSLLEARVILDTWRIEYNTARQHCLFGYQIPGEFARRSNYGLRSPSRLPEPIVAINTKNIQQNFRSELSH